MIEFKDQQGVTILFSKQLHQFPIPSTDVLVIAKSEGKWLLTEHKVRGLEFPGGKCEEEETLEQAAIREVYEETGARIDHLRAVGEYFIQDVKRPAVKTVFMAEVVKLEEDYPQLETKGRVLWEGDLLRDRFHPSFSPFMKDELLSYILDEKKQ